MKHLICLVLSIYFLAIGCRQEEMPIPTDPTPIDSTANPTKLTVIWDDLMSVDTGDYLYGHPIPYKQNVLFSYLDWDNGTTVYKMYHGKTGEVLWTWHPPRPGFANITRYFENIIFENRIVLCLGSNHLYCLNLDDGSVFWETHLLEENPNSFGLPDCIVLDDYVYHQRSNTTRDTVSFLVRANLFEGEWDTLFRLDWTDGYYPKIYPPVLWLNPSGDSILLFQSREFLLAGGNRAKLFAFNLSKNELDWVLSDFDANGNASASAPPLVHDNKLYLSGFDHLHCFDLIQAEKLWSKKLGKPIDNLLSGSPYIAEGKIFIQPALENSIYALDLNTGATIWKSDLFATSDLVYHNGLIYGGNYHLVALDAGTGEVFWEELPPNTYAEPSRTKGVPQFFNLSISPENDCIYTSDGTYFMALETYKK